MLDIESSIEEDLTAENKKLKSAISRIINYKDELGETVFNHQFKSFALQVANEAIKSIS